MTSTDKPTIIAEIGNAHEGDIDIAKQMMEVAKECGADLCKFQAGHAEGFARYKKDIPRYKKYDLGWDGYKALYLHGNAIGIPVFFSIWSADYDSLRMVEEWHKIPARQFNHTTVRLYDTEKTFISIPYRTYKLKNYGKLKGIPLHCVSKYPTVDPHLDYIPKLRKVLGIPVGYSDHTVGTTACIEAVQKYGAVAIEKHFTFRHDFGVLRDHAISADPIEMRSLCKILKG